MDFGVVLEKILELLQRSGRATYRALKLRSAVTGEYLTGRKSGDDSSRYHGPVDCAAGIARCG